MNRLSEAAKFLIIAGTILIVCSLVVVGFFVMKEGKEGTSNSMEQFNIVTSNYSDIELEKYHNLTINGSTLKEILGEKKSNKKELYQYVLIKYATLENTTPLVLSNEDYNTELTDSKKPRYINPVGAFQGEVIKDNNGVVEEIIFRQIR